MRRTRKRQGGGRVAGNQGFTLIEVMQTMVFLSIGVLGLSSLTIGTIRGNAVARQITSATVLAQDKLEELRAGPFASITTGSDRVTSGNVAYDRRWTVCLDCPMSGTKEVFVAVTWSERTDRVVRLQTIIGD